MATGSRKTAIAKYTHALTSSSGTPTPATSPPKTDKELYEAALSEFKSLTSQEGVRRYYGVGAADKIIETANTIKTFVGRTDFFKKVMERFNSDKPHVDQYSTLLNETNKLLEEGKTAGLAVSTLNNFIDRLDGIDAKPSKFGDKGKLDEMTPLHGEVRDFVEVLGPQAGEAKTVLKQAIDLINAGDFTAYCKDNGSFADRYNEVVEITDVPERLGAARALKAVTDRAADAARVYPGVKATADALLNEVRIYYQGKTQYNNGFLKRFNEITNRAATMHDPTGKLTDLTTLRDELKVTAEKGKAALGEYTPLQEKAEKLIGALSERLALRYQEFRKPYTDLCSDTEVDIHTRLTRMEELLFKAATALKMGKESAKQVKAKFAELDDTRLAQLPNKQKIGLLKALSTPEGEGKMPSPEMKRLYTAMGKAGLDEEFENRDKPKRDKVLAELKDKVGKYRENWKKLPPEDRKKAMQEALAIHCKEFKINPAPEIKLFREVPTDSPKLKGKLSNEGFYDVEDDKLYINEKASQFDDFAEAMDTVVHENTHNYQHRLIKLIDDGKLTEGHPLYDQAMFFKLNNLPGCYADTDHLVKKEGPDYDAYKGQPMEAHAWKAGGEVKKLFSELTVSTPALPPGGKVTPSKPAATGDPGKKT
jgi:hypothetical protein